ncbi:hypothetical protein QC762_0077150 [Podospora pseudocomata]|uniref:Uncharacterized protein n=1 Tax=Podospora pseudocomata TaxID=2093779 RepID=A0ABR0GAY3_9PEZI|nr:hypothetical protein QC762_0077150 [Podospora pseudocomata]
MAVSEIFSSRAPQRSLGATAKRMITAEISGLNPIGSVSPSFVPEAYGWGSLWDETTESTSYFSLASSHHIGLQTTRPASLRRPTRSSPQDIHLPHRRILASTNLPAMAPNPYDVIKWQPSWTTLFRDILGHTISLLSNSTKGITAMTNSSALVTWFSTT